MDGLTSNPWFIGIVTSIVGGGLVAVIGKLRGWWWKSRKPASVDLATRVLKYLDGEAEEKTRQMIHLTKKLGDSLVASYKAKIAHDSEPEEGAQSLISEMLPSVKSLVTELSAADEELDDLKRSVIEFQEGLEWRDRIINHLCHPPNPPTMDPGHVRSQLLDENTKPHELLNSAKGEAIIFLRGFGLGWRERQRYLWRIRREQRKIYKKGVSSEFRKVLQQTALGKAKR